MKAMNIHDGVYFCCPEGSAWIAAEFRGGRLVAQTEEANVATHAAARDRWAGIMPRDDDKVIAGAVAATIVREVMGDDVDPECVIVSTPAKEQRVFTHCPNRRSGGGP